MEKAATTADTVDGGFRLHVLASGSKGNASLVTTGNDAVLVDCGITGKAFLGRCNQVGFDPCRIGAVVVTHEHTDHTKGLGVVLRALAKRGVHPPVYCTAGTLGSSRELLALESSMDIRAVGSSTELLVGGIHVQLFPTSHDAAEPVGMSFEAVASGGNSDTLGYLTDSGVLPTPAIKLFARARILALETNHDPHMLATGPYPAFLKARIASNKGHLSNTQSAEALQAIAPTCLQAVCGMHLSETNNQHHLALEALSDAGGNFQTAAARQDVPLTIE